MCIDNQLVKRNQLKTITNPFLHFSAKVSKNCKYKHENGDCWGHDIKHYGGKTLHQCKRLCTYKNECKSIQHRGRSCWLKRYACNSGQLRNRGNKAFHQWTKLSCGASGSPKKTGKPTGGKSKPSPKKSTSDKCFTHRHGDCWGNDIKHYGGKTLDQCKSLCKARADCRSIQHRGKSCWLKWYACESNELRSKGNKTFHQWTNTCGKLETAYL
ncbi:uncharacterized protein LOC135495035 [Lineus longissimus]|uniref:uncharacterized protein LOC135495035 n=1 Tax=Lineus longissimus TaxID=88925 RepID=UPI00315DA243